MTLHAPAAVAVPVRELARLGDAMDDPIPKAGKPLLIGRDLEQSHAYISEPIVPVRKGARCKTMG